MKKIVLMLSVLMMSLMFVMSSFAKEPMKDTWMFYVYTVDSTDSQNYNEKAVFEIKNSTFDEKTSFYIESSKNVDLNNFLNFAKKNFDAEHKVLIIVGKGEGVYGIKKDGKNLSLNDIKEALSMNFVSDETSPAFDIVMFDASLMATVEMGDIVNGYADYLIAPESVMYDVNGFYLNFLSKFASVRDKNASDLSHLILDTYAKCVDDHMSRGAVITSALSLLDPEALSEAYASYKLLVKSMLKRISQNNLMMSYIARCGKLAVPMGETMTEYKHNLVDSIDFMNKLKTYYPKETGKVISSISKAVVYRVNSPFMLVTCGASLYFPLYSFDGHDKYLDNYLDIAKSDYLKALYNYKLNGNIDADTMKILKKDSIGKIASLNFSALGNYNKSKIDYKNNSLNFTIKPDKSIKPLMQDIKLVVYKRVADNIIFYNQDSYSEFDSKNNIVTAYNGEWAKLNGTPLKLDVLADNDSFTEYAADIRYNDELKKLYIVFENESSKIVGVDEKSQRADAFGTNVRPLQPGDKISVVRHIINAKNEARAEDLSREFTYNKNTKLDVSMFEDGEYTCEVQLEDVRGEKTEGALVLFSIVDGKISRVVTEEDLFKTAK